MDDESDESDLQNKDPAFIGAILSNVTEFLQLYGWFIVLALAAVYFLYSRIQPWLYRASQRREENSYKKLDVGVAQSRLEAMEKARQKMQAELDEQARVFAEQLKIKEEKKRQEKIEDWERHLQGKGYKSKTKALQYLVA
nr:selenoprotein S-like [Biomphalaria glabrata]